MDSEALVNSLNLPGPIKVEPKPRDGDGRIFRASSMGKPALETAYYYFVSEKSIPNERSQLIFWLGHAFEEWLRDLLQRSDWTIEKEQEFHDYQGITGHSDFIVTDSEGYSFVIDAKAVNARCFNTYKRYGLLDDRGYATQLSIYSATVGLPACVVMMNKENGEVSYAWLDEEDKEYRLERAVKIKQTIEEVAQTYTGREGFEECFRYFRPPIPRAERANRQYTGRLLPPTNLVGSSLLTELYETYEDVNNRKEAKTYVSDYRYPNNLIHLKPNIEADVFGS